MISTYRQCTTSTINKIVFFTLLVIIFVTAGSISPTRIVFAASLQLAWTANSEEDLSGYLLYYGTSSYNYGPPVPVGNVTEYALTDLAEDATYYLAISAVDYSNNESALSPEIIGVTEGSRNFELLNGITSSDVVEPGEEVMYYIDVPVGQANLEVALIGTNYADLYIKHGTPPITSDYDCLSYLNESDTACYFGNPVPGRWYIMVRGYSGTSDYQVIATYSDGDIELQDKVPYAGMVIPEEEDYYYIDVPVVQDNLEVTLIGTNDADLYIKHGTPPTTSDYDCLSYLNESDAACYFDNPLPGRWYIMVRGYSGTSNYQVIASYLKELTNSTLRAAVVDVDEQDHYFIDVPPDQIILDIELTGYSDADLYVRYGAPPTIDDWDCRPYESGSNESCSFGNPSAGRWYIMVRGCSDNIFYQVFTSYSGGEMELSNGVADSYWVSPGEEEHYYIDVPRSQSRIEIVLSGNNDADLYVRYGDLPTNNDWDCRPYENGSYESCFFDNPEAGRWFIVVKGYSGIVNFQIVAEFY